MIECRLCPRVFHQRCVQIQSPIPPKWVCTECVSVRNAEKHNLVDMDQLSVMLNFAMERIKSVADAQPFFKPVDTEEFPHYTEYIVCPVDISQLEDKIAKKSFASTRAFLTDFRWILHNCIIFNSFHSKLTSTARTLMKVFELISYSMTLFKMFYCRCVSTKWLKLIRVPIAMCVLISNEKPGSSNRVSDLIYSFGQNLRCRLI